MKINLGTLTVASPSFAHGGQLPDAHSSNGSGISPALTWSGVPDGTRSFAVVCHDPDAPLVGGFTHWVVYGIPGDAIGLAEGAASGFISGVNGMGEPTWAPASPPPGHGTHFYYFHLFAIGSDASLEPGLSAEQLLERIDESILAQARIVGTYRND
jgi:Raf kinase inhibitor-like YbhB/YbcL family protein